MEISGKQGNRRGVQCEKRVLDLLLTTKKLPDWMIGPIWMVGRKSPLDGQGIDIMVGTTVGYIGIQVKATYFKAGRRARYYEERGIATVLVNHRRSKIAKSDKQLLGDIISRVRGMYIQRKKENDYALRKQQSPERTSRIHREQAVPQAQGSESQYSRSCDPQHHQAGGKDAFGEREIGKVSWFKRFINYIRRIRRHG